MKRKEAVLMKTKPNVEEICAVEEELATELLKLQREDLEKEIVEIKETNNSKGKSAAIFKLFRNINGSKKLGQEQVAMKDPFSNSYIYDPEEIKRTSLKYCSELLQNSQGEDSFRQEIFIQNMLHLVRMEKKEISIDDCENTESLSVNDFKARIKLLEKKCPSKYKFLLKSGDEYKKAVFNLCSLVWRKEQKPDQWRNTIIIQIYKGKGSKEDFNNQRNIHTKDEVPKVFEGMLVDKSKERIVSSCTKFQIGGLPGHRASEHLFLVKSVMAYYYYLNIPLILQVYDISKYFDKESLRDTMDTLFQAGIQGKLYRLWFEMNRNTKIKVKTAVGMSEVEATGENVAQGSIGGALASSANLDRTLNMFFQGSDGEISYDDIRLNPITFQDDTAHFITDVTKIHPEV